MKFKNQILYFVSVLSVALMTFSCTNDDTKDVVKLPSIVDIAKADPANFSILVDALNKTQMPFWYRYQKVGALPRSK